MVSSAIWKKHARVSFSKTIKIVFEKEVFEKVTSVCFSNCTRNHTITYYNNIHNDITRL
jgi:hypothetical protein